MQQNHRAGMQAGHHGIIRIICAFLVVFVPVSVGKRPKCNCKSMRIDFSKSIFAVRSLRESEIRSTIAEFLTHMIIKILQLLGNLFAGQCRKVRMRIRVVANNVPIPNHPCRQFRLRLDLIKRTEKGCGTFFSCSTSNIFSVLPFSYPQSKVRYNRLPSDLSS